MSPPPVTVEPSLYQVHPVGVSADIISQVTVPVVPVITKLLSVVVVTSAVINKWLNTPKVNNQPITSNINQLDLLEQESKDESQAVV